MKPKRVFFGWWIVAGGVGLTSLSSALFVYGFGAFFIAWREYFGWSRAILGSLIGISRMEGGVFAPLAGWLIDKYGPRRIMFVGITLFGLGFLALSRVNSLPMLYLVYAGLLATGSSLGTFRPLQVAVANWFVRRRGLAMGIVVTGWGLGGSFVFILGLIIDAYGWRVAAVLAGLTLWVVGLPIAGLMRHKPEQSGLLPDGDKSPEGVLVPDGENERSVLPQIDSEDQSQASMSPDSQKPRHFWMRDPRPEVDFTTREALRTRAFWCMALTYGIWAATPTINTVFLAPFLTEELNVSAVVALSALSFFAFASMFGRLPFGFIADHVNVRLLTVFLLIMEGLGIYLFSHIQHIAQAPYFIIMFAVAHGGLIPLRTVLQGYFFGRKSFGTIGGILTIVDLPSSVAAPIWIGYLADVLPGGYRIGFRIIAVSLIIAATSMLLATRPKSPGIHVSTT